MEKGTNKNTFVSVGKWGLVALGVYLGYRFLKNSYKKELKTLSDAKEQENKEIESLGVSSERMRAQVYDCEREVDRNMVKAMYVAVEAQAKTSGYIEEMINIDEVLSSQTIIHVTEEKGYKDLKYLTFLLEIPENSVEKKGSFTIPKIGDYYFAMNQLKDILWREYAVSLKEPIKKKTIYLVYSHRDPKAGEGDYDMVTESVEIPESIWARWQDEHPGPGEFYRDVRENGLNAIKKKGALEEFQDLLTNDFLAKNPDCNPSEFAVHYNDLILMYKISFREARDKGDYFGINVKAALDCLKYISEKFEVTRKGTKNGGIKYDRIMFHAPNDNGAFDSLMRFYMTDKNNRVVFDTYAWSEEESEKGNQYSPNSVMENAKIKSDKRLNNE